MRIYWESLKKWGKRIGIPIGISGFALLFYYLIFIEAIVVTGYSGDMVCQGTIEDPCFAFINFTAKEDIFLYPVGYDPWGRNTPFYTNQELKSWKMYRSWGKGWREIKLNDTCTGTWCGAPDKGVKYSFVFRENRDYKIKIVAYKNSPYEDIKWGFGPVDPIWYGKDWIPDTLLTDVIAETGDIQILFSDSFTTGSDENLEDHSPDVGDSWTRLLKGTGGSETLLVAEASDTVVGGVGGFSDYVLYTADATYSTADYYVQAKIVKDEDDDELHFLGVRIQDGNNMYVLGFNADTFKLYKRVGGSWSDVSTDKGAQVVDNDLVRLKIVGTTLSAEVNDNEIVSETVEDFAAAGKAGYGMGALIVDSDDMASQEIDDFLVMELGGRFTHLNISTTAPYDNLVGYWNFDGDREDTLLTTAYDFTKYGRDGTGAGQANTTSTGCLTNFGNCLRLDGDGDYVNIGDFDVIFNLTISAWIKASEVKIDQRIVSKWSDTNADRSYLLSTDNADSNEFSFAIYQDGNYEVCDSNTQGIYSANEWVHVVGTYANDDCFIYVNGVDRTDHAVDGTTTGIENTATPLRIGEQGDGSGYYFNGSIDEVMIFNTALTPTQISDIYNNQSARFAGTGTQQLNNQSYLNLSGDYINITTTFDNNFESNLSLFLQYYSGGAWSSTSAQNLTSGQNATFDIGTSFTNITLNYTLIAGPNQTSTFYTPIVYEDINIWNHTIAVAEPEITYSVAVPLNLIRFGDCSPDFENADSRPIGQNAIVGAINATNTGGASGDFTINLTGALNTGWIIWASNDSLVHNITLSTTAQTIWSDVEVDETKKIWLAANCSFISSNPGQSITMWVA